MDIVKALRRLEHTQYNGKCMQSASLGIKITMKDKEIYTVINGSIGRGLMMRYRHLRGRNMQKVYDR